MWDHPDHLDQLVGQASPDQQEHQVQQDQRDLAGVMYVATPTSVPTHSLVYVCNRERRVSREREER